MLADKKLSEDKKKEIRELLPLVSSKQCFVAELYIQPAMLSKYTKNKHINFMSGNSMNVYIHMFSNILQR